MNTFAPIRPIDAATRSAIGFALLLFAAAGPAAPPKPRLIAFDLSEVRLLPGFAKTAQDTNTRYLLSLDPDRLLHNFRVNAGLAAMGKPYGGWEAADCELRGHFVGHYVSACAMTYASTGDPRLKARADLIVGEWAKCQKALGGEYLSAFPTSFWDRLEALRQIPWAPYYTIHKIMAGLFDAYKYCGNKQALQIVKGMASYFKKRIDPIPEDRWRRILNVEFGGMNDILYKLYEVTHDPAHLALAHRFDKEVFLEPLAEGKDRLAGLHGNTHIPIAEGAARRYEITGEKKYRRIVEFFWDTVVHHHSFATGGSTNAELWGPPDKLAHTLSTTNHETCKTYNMLKVTRDLIRWTADPKYADYYERAWLNGIWGTQEPKTGQLEYYVPMLTGASRNFGDAESSFWCCYGTGVENWSKLGDSVYFHDGRDLWVNLFVPSRLAWRSEGVTVTQTTRFPAADSTRLVVSTRRPVSFGIHLRIPSWAVRGVQVLVNGRMLKSAPGPGSYIAVRRKWRRGDSIELKMPFELHVMPLQDDADTVAVLNGPLVLAGLVGGAERTRSRFPSNLDQNPDWVLTGTATEPNQWLKPVRGIPGAFETPGRKTPIRFEPFYKVVGEPYGVYWPVLQRGSARAKQIAEDAAAEARIEARTFDSVTPRRRAVDHGFQGSLTNAGGFMGRSWRDAQSGGWFSWDLNVLPDANMTLAVTYWGGEIPPRTFDILVDGTVLATQSLDRNKPGRFFTVEYDLPPNQTQGKHVVTVRFQPHAGNTAGGVFGCRMLKP